MISVIMSTFNESENYVRLAIESILNQTYKDIEFIIIIDNPDNSDMIKLINEYQNRDERIRLIQNEVNLGLTESLNKGLIIANGEYIARMDADDIAERNRLEKQIEYIEKFKLDLVGCSMRRISQEGKVLYEITNKSYSSKCISNLIHYDNCVPHPSWLVRRKLYESLGGYRDVYACEDYDFLLRAVLKGYHIGLCDDVLMNYRINTTGISRNNSLRQTLTGDYLQKNKDRIDDVSKIEIEKYINSVLTKKKEANYEIALTELNQIIENLKHKKILAMLKIPFLIIKSRYIMLNITKIIKMLYIKRKYK